MVRNPETREPADSEARKICEFLKNDGVLLGVSGPHSNVIKIRPPMVFSQENADQLLDCLQRALASEA